MARKTRLDLRREHEAAEKLEEAEGGTAATKTRKRTTKTTTKRKSSRTAKEVRLKAFWGVFNQSLKRIALYEYSQKKEAQKKAAELTEAQNSPHFVQPVKEEITE